MKQRPTRSTVAALLRGILAPSSNPPKNGTHVVTELHDELLLHSRDQLAVRASSSRPALFADDEELFIVGAFVRPPSDASCDLRPGAWFPEFLPIALCPKSEALLLLRALADAITRGDERFDARPSARFERELKRRRATVAAPTAAPPTAGAPLIRLRQKGNSYKGDSQKGDSHASHN